MENKVITVKAANKIGIMDHLKEMWYSVSGDKISTGMFLIFIMSIFGYAMDRNYGVKIGHGSVDLGKNRPANYKSEKTSDNDSDLE